MVRGETWSHWVIFLDVWNTSQLRQDLLPFGGWNWSIIRESTLPGEIIFWYRVRSTSLPRHHNTHIRKKKNQTSTRNSPWRLILVGFTIINWVYPSIHPSIHSASMISTPIPSHPIPSIHPFIQPSPSCLECAGWIMLIGFPDHSVLYYYYPAHSKGPITTTTFVPSSPNSLAP